ncbi:hypothetical protein ACNKHX_05600 [Shigella flexneri]
MSFGRTSTFLDVYIERDLRSWPDHRARSAGRTVPPGDEAAMVRFLRTPEDHEMFSGDPMGRPSPWAVWALMAQIRVTKNSFRLLTTPCTRWGSFPNPT